MANLFLANGKKAKLLDQERTFLNTCILHLFTNNITVSATTVAGDFSETTDSGYSPSAITFATATLNGSNQGQMVAPAVTFTFNHDVGDFTIYGWFLIDPADSALVMSQNTTNFTVTGAGQTYTVTPKVLLDRMT